MMVQQPYTAYNNNNYKYIYVVFVNRPYSKVNKSTKAKVAAIFSLPVKYNYTFFCVFATMKKCELVFEASSHFDCCNNTESIPRRVVLCVACLTLGLAGCWFESVSACAMSKA
jgi:hypothetical protein